MGVPLKPRLSFIVATRNRSAVLADALASIDAQDLPSEVAEIVIADDGSSDDTRAVVERFADQSRLATVWERVEGRGVNAARNTGIRRAQGEVVVFIDDDELVPPEYGRNLLGLLDAHANSGAFGGPVVMHSDRRGPRQCAQCREEEDKRPAIENGIVVGLLGGNLAIRCSALEQAGLFDEALSGRGDDTEWFHRAQTRGIPLIADDALLVWHRRDFIALRTLLVKAYRDGQNLPNFHATVGSDQPARPSLVARYSAHALTRLCTHGLVLATNEVGHLVGDVQLRRNRGSA